LKYMGRVGQGCQIVIFQQKIPIWVNFGESFNGRCWYIVWPFRLFYLHLVYFVAIWYIAYGHLEYFFPCWYVVTRKIWQPWRRWNSLYYKIKFWNVFVVKYFSSRFVQRGQIPGKTFFPK
jgi:hypothetical protein